MYFHLFQSFRIKFYAWTYYFYIYEAFLLGNKYQLYLWN